MERKPEAWSIKEPILICNPRLLIVGNSSIKIVSFMVYEDGHITALIQERVAMLGKFGTPIINKYSKKEFEELTKLNIDEIADDNPIKFDKISWDLVAAILIPALMGIVGTENGWVLGILILTQLVFLFRLLISKKK